MKNKIIAWDLGTGGNKASLYDTDGNCIAAVFIPYETAYPRHGWHEQKPLEWWNAVVRSTRRLIDETRTDCRDIACCGISGHSLSAVPLDRDGTLLRESTPIWSDGRAVEQARQFFARYPEPNWYRMTGNGFPPQLYTVFKIMWYRDNEPGMFNRIRAVVGTKDYINFRLTGAIVTDPSYASGSGLYDLAGWSYSKELIQAAAIPREILPDIVPSTRIIGPVTPAAAQELGLHTGVMVTAGGVDNSCMALGARAFREGRVYNSLGSSCWIAVSSAKPLIDQRSRPYVFAHVAPGMYAAALGAAAVAAVGGGLWKDFERIDSIHRVEAVTAPDRDTAALYERMLPAYRQAVTCQAGLGDAMAAMGN